MSRFRIFGVALVAVFALSVVVAATASALEFLLAVWLLAGVAVTTPVLVDGAGDVILLSLKGGGLNLVVEILCEGILDGFVETEGLGLITELLDTEELSISSVPLVESALICTNLKNCAEPLVWADNLPVVTEVYLMIDEGVAYFIGLGFEGGFYISCMALGISELCEAAESAVELTNSELEGSVDATTSDAFQLLAGLKLGTCTLGGVETAELEGLATILDLEGVGSLAVSE
jgi:hypothetical protein